MSPKGVEGRVTLLRGHVPPKNEYFSLKANMRFFLFCLYINKVVLVCTLPSLAIKEDRPDNLFGHFKIVAFCIESLMAYLRPLLNDDNAWAVLFQIKLNHIISEKKESKHSYFAWRLPLT